MRRSSRARCYINKLSLHTLVELVFSRVDHLLPATESPLLFSRQDEALPRYLTFSQLHKQPSMQLTLLLLAPAVAHCFLDGTNNLTPRDPPTNGGYYLENNISPLQYGNTTTTSPFTDLRLDLDPSIGSTSVNALPGSLGDVVPRQRSQCPAGYISVRTYLPTPNTDTSNLVAKLTHPQPVRRRSMVPPPRNNLLSAGPLRVLPHGKHVLPSGLRKSRTSMLSWAEIFLSEWDDVLSGGPRMCTRGRVMLWGYGVPCWGEVLRG